MQWKYVTLVFVDIHVQRRKENFKENCLVEKGTRKQTSQKTRYKKKHHMPTFFLPSYDTICATRYTVSSQSPWKLLDDAGNCAKKKKVWCKRANNGNIAKTKRLNRFKHVLTTSKPSSPDCFESTTVPPSMAQTGICSEPNFTGFGISWFSWFSWVRSISELMSLHRDLASAVETNKVSKTNYFENQRMCATAKNMYWFYLISSVINLREFPITPHFGSSFFGVLWLPWLFKAPYSLSACRSKSHTFVKWHRTMCPLHTIVWPMLMCISATMCEPAASGPSVDWLAKLAKLAWLWLCKDWAALVFSEVACMKTAKLGSRF